MYFEQFYLGCLAHASYMLGSEGEAAVVDPQRDVEIYLKAAEQQDLQEGESPGGKPRKKPAKAKAKKG